LLLTAACTRFEHADVKVPSPSFWLRTPFPASYIIGVPWCVNTSVMFKVIRLERRLTNGEAWTLIGNCYLPVVGGALVTRVWGDSPRWNEYPLDVNVPIGHE
jgi:hypothetical protein